MKVFLIAFLLLQVASQDLSGQKGQSQLSEGTWKVESGKWKIERRVPDTSGCIYPDGTGNAYSTYWGNSCPQGMQFTIQWYGNQPARNVVYRTNNRPYVRTVQRQDINGALISEAPATMGLGPHTDHVRIEETQMPQQTLLSLVNGELQPIWVGGFISVRKNGNEVIRCNLGILVEALGRERACVYFPGMTYVYVLDAEKDPS
jgi:hypothetical protein